MSRVVIDTEGLRSLAQYTQGALTEVARIRAELLRVQAQVDHGPGRDAFGPLLGALTDFGTVLADDRRNLVTEVLGVEAEEGVAPAVSTSATAPAHPAGGRSSLVALLPMLTVAALRNPPAPPPEPWNTTWVTAGGTIPIGGNTRTMSHQPGTPEEYNLGEQWETASASDGSIGRNSSRASLEIKLSGGTGTSETTDARGNTTYNWETYQEMVVRGHAETSGNAGDINYRAQATGQAGAEANIHVWAREGPDGYSIGGEANAKVYAEANASAEAGMDGVGSGEVHAKASTGAEAKAHAKAGVSDDGVSGGVGAQAYAGNDARVGGKGDLGPIKGGDEISVGTGLGVGFSSDFSFDWDDIGFDFAGKLGLGISLGIDTSLHFSPSGLVDGVGALLDGDNPFDASGAEWDRQAGDLAQQEAARQAEHARNDLVNEAVATGDMPPASASSELR